ncbi:MAG: hypothetical protein AAGB22_09745, partial [Bacteroidota bacterium]
MSHKLIRAVGTAMAMLISVALFGQSKFIEQSMKSDFFANEVSYVGNNQGLHYIWEQGPSNTQGLLVLDEALNLVDRLEFKLMHKKYSFAVKHLVLQGDEIRVFGVRKPQLKQVQQIGAQTIDLNTLTLKPDFAIVCEVPKTAAGGNLALAKNNSYLLYSNASIQKTDGKVSDQFTFLDINGQVIRQDTIEQNISGLNVKRTLVFPAHDKSVVLLRHLKPVLSGESNSETDGFMRLTRYDFASGRSDTLIMPQLDAPKKRYNTRVNYLGRGKLAFSGMYDLPDSIYHQGAYFHTLNVSEQTGSPISYIPLDQGHASIGLFGNMLKNWEKGRKNGSAYRPFQTRVEVLEHPDNSLTFVLERFSSS